MLFTVLRNAVGGSMCTQFLFGCTVCYHKHMCMPICAISYNCECNNIVGLTCGASDAYCARFNEIRERLGASSHLRKLSSVGACKRATCRQYNTVAIHIYVIVYYVDTHVGQ